MEILFSPEIIAAAPDLKVLAVESNIVNAPTSDPLWDEMRDAVRVIGERYAIDQINKRPAISATRMAYKHLGKEPNRYRPSAEALCRRIVNGKGLYRTLSAIDMINLVSILTGYSIGGFDADKIQGDTLTLGVGREGEEFHAIGRGLLNVAHLPLYRDAAGGIGTPTSDEQRTSLSESTTRLLMLVNIYGEETDPMTTGKIITRLLNSHCSATSTSTRLLHAADHQTP